MLTKPPNYSSLGLPCDTCMMHMLINICLFSLVNLPFASLIYRAPAREPKMGRGRDSPFPSVSTM